MNPSGAIELVVITVCDIYIMIVLARFILQMVRADFYNPISQFIVKATSPVLNPLRRVIPGFGGIDIASIVLLVILVIAKLALWLTLQGYGLQAMASLGFMVLLLKSMANTLIDFFTYAIFIMVIMSWIAQGSYNAIYDIVRQNYSPHGRPGFITHDCAVTANGC